MTNSRSKSLEESVKTMIKRLCNNKQLPKYQFERCSDVFISMFLGDWLEKELEEKKLLYITNEFPLQKGKSNKSTNVDYVYRGSKKIYFIELKTDSSSFRAEQISIYSNFEGKKLGDFKDFLAGLADTNGPSKSPDKYRYLLKQFNDDDWSRTIQFILVSPEIKKRSSTRKKENLPEIKRCSISEFIKAESLKTAHPELWKILQPRLVEAFKPKNAHN